MKMLPLGDLCRITIGRTPSRSNSDYWGGSHPWATISDLHQSPVIETREGITDRAVTDLGLRAVEAGTLLYSFKLTIGKMAVAGTSLYTNEAVAALVPRETSQLDPTYLRFALATVDAGAGSSIAVKGRTLNSESLANLRVPWIPVSQQHAVARSLEAHLDLTRSLRASIDSRSSLVRALRTSLISQTYGAHARTEGATRSIASLATVQTGYAFRSDWFRKDGVRLLRNANVRHRSIDWEDVVYLDEAMEPRFEPFRLREGDIVLSLDRPLVAGGLKVSRIAKADVPSLLLQRVARLVPSPDLDPDYLFGFLLSGEFAEAVSGHDQSLGIPHLSPHQVGAVEFSVPSVSEQRRISAEFSERLLKIDAIEASVRAEFEAIEAFPAALLRRAFGDLPA